MARQIDTIIQVDTVESWTQGKLRRILCGQNKVNRGPRLTPWLKTVAFIIQWVYILHVNGREDISGHCLIIRWISMKIARSHSGEPWPPGDCPVERLTKATRGLGRDGHIKKVTVLTKLIHSDVHLGLCAMRMHLPWLSLVWNSPHHLRI